MVEGVSYPTDALHCMSVCLDSGLRTLALIQGGMFTAEQALGRGVSRKQLKALVGRGLLDQPHPKVFGLPGAAHPFGAEWAAHLQIPLSVVSHHSAGRVHRVEGTPGDIVSVTIPHGCRAEASGVVIHQSRDLPSRHVMEVDGLLVTRPYRTVVDLAPHLSRSRLNRVVDDVVTRRHGSLEGLGAVLAQVRRRGRAGGPRLELVLDDKAGAPIARTALEALLDSVLAPLGLPRPLAEHPLPSDGRMTGFVDRTFPEALLIVEADGRRWHARHEQMAKDRHRDREAARHGYLTVRVMYEELVADPAGVRDDLVAIYRDRCRVAISL